MTAIPSVSTCDVEAEIKLPVRHRGPDPATGLLQSLSS